VPSARSSPSSFLLATSAGPAFLDVAPRLVKNFSELLENLGRFVKAVLIPGAALFRFVNTGVVCSANFSSRSIAGPSWRRKAGKSLRFWASAPRWAAVAWEILLL